MSATWSFHSAGRLVFGWGAVARLGELAARHGINRALVVTDKTLAAAGIVEQAAAPLAAAGIRVEVFDGGQAEPSLEVADRAADAAGRFAPQAIVGLGGGSNMDLAKVTAVRVAHGGPASRFFGFDNVPGPVLPLLCVPTTAGTGSEVSHAAVLTDTANEMKVSTLSNYLRPAVAVVDPALTLSCPPKVTADSGIDALTHAIEARLATDHARLAPGTGYEGANPLGDMLADRAIEMIGRHLPAAVREPANRAAREAMALAATLAGMAFSNSGVALVHALEYPLGGALHCSHGAGNGLLLPYVMRFNLPHRKSELARIAALLGEEVDGLSVDAAAERAIAAVARLRSQIGIPERIRDIGGRAEQLPGFAAKAFGLKRLMHINPRPATEEDLLRILQEAL